MGIKITNTMVRTAQRCQMQYLYKFEDMLAPNRPGIPLKRGSWIHELLEIHYTGGDWRLHHMKLRAQFLKMFEEEREYYGDLPDHCNRLMRGYLLKWAEEDKNMRIICAEQEFTVKLPHGHTLQFKVDLVTEDEYGVWLWEHKTHKTIPRSDYRFLDVQTTRYLYGLAKNGLRPTGILWNYLRTKPPTVPKLTPKTGVLSNRKIDTELYTYLVTLKKLGLNPRNHRDKINWLRRSEEYFRRVRTPRPWSVVNQLVREAVVTADRIERGIQPVRSVDRTCEYACSYKDLCITDLYGGDSESLIKANYHTREPGEYYGDDPVEED